MGKDIGIWNEKYRPESIDDFLGQDEIKEKFKTYIHKKDLPHLLLCGFSGVGKSSLSKILARRISGSSYLYFNASNERGIDTVRNKIERFCSTKSLGDNLKIIICDEYDNMTPDAQKAARHTIEKYHKKVRFILTANYRDKIIDAIQSRCTIYTFEGPPKKPLIAKMCKILKKENVEYETQDVVKVVNWHYPDIRSTIDSLQQLTIDGKLKDISKLRKDREELFDLIKKQKYEKIEEHIGHHNYTPEELFRFLWKKGRDLDKSKKVPVWLTIAEYTDAASRAVDKFIIMCACAISVSEILGE